MELVLIAFGVVSLAELSLWLPGLWRWHRVLASVVLIVLAIVSGLLVAQNYYLWQWLILFFSVYRVVNLLRLVENRSNEVYLRRTSLQASLWLIGIQLLVLLVTGALNHVNVTAETYVYIDVIGGIFLGCILISSTMRHLKTTRPPEISEHYANRDLPTVTVAIPARNETEELETCLQSLLESTYSKLEILVLDDCSQNRRTPEILREFAQKGVRFVAGKVPPEHWLAKNYAYEQLANEANGELLLFCGVDTQFTPDSLLALVETMLSKNKTMLSVLPKNFVPKRRLIGTLLIQPGRYAWEIALPRRLLERPPVLSTCWLIKKDTLKQAGGFKAVTRSIIPERYFASYAARHKDGYSFISSGAAISVTSNKLLSEQLDTAIRTRYPALHHRPELVAITTLSQLVFVLAPFLVCLVTLFTSNWPLAGLSLMACLLFVATNALVSRLTYRRFLWQSVFLTPLTTLFDCWLLNYSLGQYEFGEVIWKDRNVCVPAMQVIPSLPKT